MGVMVVTTPNDPKPIGRRRLGALAAAGLAAAGLGSARADDASETPDSWPVLRPMIFGKQQVADGSKLIALDAPYRALDAAMVPISVQLLADPGRVRRLTLVIDQNPVPLAARFTLGDRSGIGLIATRVRVNDYTNIRAVAELDDATLRGVARFVKAAGGCSAPMAKEEAGSIALGTMRFRELPGKPGTALREAQLMIRHPNNSGMQMDQLTQLYIPAHYITSVRIFQGTDLLLAAETGVSMAQNPELRFSFRPNGASTFRAEAIDNKGKHFTGEWPAEAAS